MLSWRTDARRTYGLEPGYARQRGGAHVDLIASRRSGVKTKAEIVKDWLPRYTGRPLDEFGKYILLSNFGNYVEHVRRAVRRRGGGPGPAHAVGHGRGPHHPQLRHGQRHGGDGHGPALGRRAQGRACSWASAAG